MREYGFELALCASIERDTDAIVARQLGVGRRSRRVMDIVCIEPGPSFADRTAITPESIPDSAIEATVGPGKARYWREAFSTDRYPEPNRQAMERAVEIGFLERKRRSGRTYVRQAVRYPDWFDRLRGIENKPDLAEPGELSEQLRKDLALAALDEIVVATASHVTGAHLNRIPESVGVWRFDPETGERTVIREPLPQDTDGPGIELLAEHAGRTEIRPVTACEKARTRRRVAERAYGKGWRTWTIPSCGNGAARGEGAAEGLPVCEHFGRVINPARECHPACPGHVPGDPPRIDLESVRNRWSPWVRDPPGRTRTQTGLDLDW